MAEPNRFAAMVLEQAAPAYAGYAAHALLERVPDIPEQTWREHLGRRVQELAAALRAGETQLFVSRVVDTREAFKARDLHEGNVAESLRALREVLVEHLPDKARDDAAAYIDAALAALERPSGDGEEELDSEQDADRLALSYLLTVLEGDARAAIDLVVEAIDNGLDPRKAYTDVLLPAQREVGRMWHAGDVTVAEEHIVTETTQRAMAVVAQRTPRAPGNGKTVLAASVAGNVHVIGPRAICDLAEMDGWRAICLGADVPAADVAAGAAFFQADVVLVSAALAIHLKAVETTLAALRASDHETKIMVGGSAFAETPDLWRRLGADGYAAGALDAVQAAAALV